MFGLEVIFGPVEPLIRIISTTIISYPIKVWILRAIAMRSAKNAVKPLKRISWRKKILLQLDLYRWYNNRSIRKHNKRVMKQRKLEAKIHRKRVREIDL